MIKLFVGLGNPGFEYQDTRHNAGFWWIEALAAKLKLTLNSERAYKGLTCRGNHGGQAFWLLMPQTFMNLSGQSVGALANFYKIKPEEILVIHDELDIPFGTLRVKDSCSGVQVAVGIWTRGVANTSAVAYPTGTAYFDSTMTLKSSGPIPIAYVGPWKFLWSEAVDRWDTFTLSSDFKTVAASPAVALKKGLPTYYFVERHVFFAALGTLLMIVISFSSPAGVRRRAASACASTVSARPSSVRLTR